ncbi:Kae1-associated serine/threonine protein kinase [Candidatus Woesearchaeota archaeon]|nr:Kae1-associated serine/threonine protein kinase [Candidatus Woesearchaeota archaeon]
MKILSRGAEAVVYTDAKTVVKQRQPKKYRINEIDEKLRLHRMRREVKVIEALQQLGVPVPKVLDADEKTTTITLQLIDGKKVRDTLNDSNCKLLAANIGKSIGTMHNNNITHGDLTTSNIIHGNRDGRAYLIDFGLSLFSNKDEDKAVDLHLFRQALKSSHSRIAEKCFAAAMTAYKQSNGGWKEVLIRLGKVEERGRYKGKKAT